MRHFTKQACIATIAIFTAAAMIGCSSYHNTSEDLEGRRDNLEAQAKITLDRFEAKDSTLRHFLDNSAGYVVIPEITKGAVGIGGAHGVGVVYEGNSPIGYTTVKQGSIGAQLGGQVYSQIIFFEDEMALNHFKQGNMELSARASAVAASSGAAAEADYEEGVAVFVMPRTGLMFEAAVGGQKFSYEPRS